MISLSLQYAVGDDLIFQGAKEEFTGCGSVLLAGTRSGTIVDMATEKEVRSLLPEVIDIVFGIKKGDFINVFEHGGNILGYALINTNSHENYLQSKESIERALKIVVHPEKESVRIKNKYDSIENESPLKRGS